MLSVHMSVVQYMFQVCVVARTFVPSIAQGYIIYAYMCWLYSWFVFLSSTGSIRVLIVCSHFLAWLCY